jgi:hypothetical protein
MGPNGGLWKDLPHFNAYITRVQSFLQAGKPDADVLLYFPIHDLWHSGEEKLPLFTMHNQDQWLHQSAFHRAAMELRDGGVSTDFVSDRLLDDLEVKDRQLVSGGNRYPLLIVPESRYLPEKTAARLAKLREQGANIIALGKPGRDVPGHHDLDARRKQLATSEARIDHAGTPDALPIFSKVGASAPEMDLARLGIRHVRRLLDDGHAYFLVNSSGKAIDAPVKLSRPHQSAVLLDPMSGRSGVALRGEGIRLVLAPGESRIVRTFSNKQATGPLWLDPEPSGDPIPLTGTWQVRFLDGGPALPPPFETPTLASWTTQAGDAYRNFSGTAVYRLEFDAKDLTNALLDLGEISHTAKVRLNGKPAGTCWAPPHRLPLLGLLEKGKNVLEVEVTNLAANRIADLDRRKVGWKAFHEINFVNIDYQPFDAAPWPALPSGLLGPVNLIPLR